MSLLRCSLAELQVSYVQAFPQHAACYKTTCKTLHDNKTVEPSLAMALSLPSPGQLLLPCRGKASPTSPTSALTSILHPVRPVRPGMYNASWLAPLGLIAGLCPRGRGTHGRRRPACLRLRSASVTLDAPKQRAVPDTPKPKASGIVPEQLATLDVQGQISPAASSTRSSQLSLRDFLLGLDHKLHGRNMFKNWIKVDKALEVGSAGALQQSNGQKPAVPDGFSSATKPTIADVKDFFVVADWNDWGFERMATVNGSKSCSEEWLLDVKLSHEGGEFQIACDGDWSRVLYPSGMAGEVDGPDAEGHGQNWCLNGRVGDTYLLRLAIGDSGPVVSWDLVEEGPRAVDSFDDFSDWSGTASGWQEAIQRMEDTKRWGGDYRAARSEALRLCGEAGASVPALELLEDIWSEDKQSNEPSRADYQSVLLACERSGDAVQAAMIRQEMLERGEDYQPERFCLTPRVYWNRDVRRMGCGASNTLDWHGGDPLPSPPTKRTWLLPASDTMAVEIAMQQEALRSAGWMILSCDPEIVRRLDDKVALQSLAHDMGLSTYFPKRFTSPELARYPCILKPAAGEFGAGVEIVYSAESVRRITIVESGELSCRWLLQELVTGCYEYSTSLLVENGRILEKACIRYQYDAEEYVWPHVNETNKELVEPSECHMAVMEKLVQGYSGFVNFNYKIREEDAQMLIMEANARVGADLACDVPRPHARNMLQMLDDLQQEL